LNFIVLIVFHQFLLPHPKKSFSRLCLRVNHSRHLGIKVNGDEVCLVIASYERLRQVEAARLIDTVHPTLINLRFEASSDKPASVMIKQQSRQSAIRKAQRYRHM